MSLCVLSMQELCVWLWSQWLSVDIVCYVCRNCVYSCGLNDCQQAMCAGTVCTAVVSMTADRLCVQELCVQLWFQWLPIGYVCRNCVYSCGLNDCQQAMCAGTVCTAVVSMTADRLCVQELCVQLWSQWLPIGYVCRNCVYSCGLNDCR